MRPVWLKASWHVPPRFLRFDLEESKLELERVKRRMNELDMAYRAAMADSGAAGGGGASEADKKQAGARFKRDRDAEGVVEALKRVVEKLRNENEKLRRGANEASKVHEAEKRAKELRGKVGVCVYLGQSSFQAWQ